MEDLFLVAVERVTADSDFVELTVSINLADSQADRQL